MPATAKTQNFPATVRFRAEPGLSAAVAQAARLSRTSAGEYLRRAVRDRIVADGISLPPIPARPGRDQIEDGR